MPVTARATSSMSPGPEPWAFPLSFAKGLGDHSRYNVTIGSSTSILGPNIPASTKETFISHLASYNMWALQGEQGWAGALCSGWASEEMIPLSTGQETVMFFFSCSKFGVLCFKSAGQALTCFCQRQRFSSVPLVFRISLCCPMSCSLHLSTNNFFNAKPSNDLIPSFVVTRKRNQA